MLHSWSTTLTLLVRLRIVILLVLAVAAGAAWAYRFAAIPKIDLALVGATFVMSVGAAFAAQRHLGLAIVTAIAPLGGLAAGAVLSGEPGLRTQLAFYGLGVAAALLAADAFVTGLLAQGDRKSGAASALRVCWPSFLAVAFAGAAILAGWFGRAMAAQALAASALGASLLAFAVLGVPLGASLFRFGEEFFSRANRLREAREGLLGISTAVCTPRWALSVSGIVIVLGTLAWFEGRVPVPVATFGSPLLWTASGAGAAAIAFAIGRDWREAAAVVPALAVPMLVALWLWQRFSAPLSIAGIPWLAAVALAAFLPMLLALGQARAFRATGDDAATARLRALEKLGLAPFCATCGAALAALPWIVVDRWTGVLCVLLVLAGCAAVLFQPAVATALEQIVPRRRSVDKLYGRR